MKTSFFLALFLVALITGAAAQQKELKFRNFTQEDGLPSNECYAVFRDTHNYTWIASDQGVVRYSGTQMNHYSLPDNVVFKIREDSHGRIWFFSHTGKLAYFFNEKIYPYQYNDSIAKYISGLLITDAYVDGDGKVELNSGGSDYSYYDISAEGKVSSHSFFSPNRADSNVTVISRTADGGFLVRRQLYYSLSSKLYLYVRGIPGVADKKYKATIGFESYNHIGCVQHNGYLYYYGGKDVIRLNPDGTIVQKRFSSDILCVQASGENLWIGMIKNGAMLVDENLLQIDGQHIFPGLSITSITIDYEGGSWFSSLERGVFYLKNILVYNLRGDEALSRPVSRIFNVHDSLLLFTNELGVHKFDNDQVSLVFSQPNDNVSELELHDRILYLGCKLSTSDMFFSARKFPVHNALADTTVVIQASSEMTFSGDKKIYSMLGSLMQGFDLSKPEKGYPLSFHPLFNNGGGKDAKFMFIDSKSTVWIGGTSMLSIANKDWSEAVPFKPESPVFQKGVTHIRQMNNGMYVIGLRFGGIVLMKDTTIIANITEANGLLNNSVKFLLPQDDKLWVATAKGISVIHFQSFQPLLYTITNIGKSEGFSNIIIKQLIPYQGNILAATSNGIYVIEKPETFLERKLPEIPLYINNVSYYKGDTAGINSISVPFNKNRIKISFTAISFNSPEEIKYYYRFDKTDTTWQSLSSTELLLENLSSGTYNLELRAGIPGQQRFSALQKFTVIVEKPWWQNNWLILAVIVFILIAGVVFYKSRIKLITRKANVRARQKTKMLELEQTALRSQMNPHFIFNSLTSIQQLIVNNKADQANEHLVKFARLIRKTLELSARPYIRIAEEKEYLQEYLVLEQFRIPGEFEFSFDIDENIDIHHTEIPNMMLQPIVENCIRHGIKHLENRKGIISIHMKMDGDVICCTITDNGIGRNHTESKYEGLFTKQKSYGMEIVRKRLELFPWVEQRDLWIEIIDLQNADGTAAGTKVIVQLPYKILNE